MAIYYIIPDLYPRNKIKIKNLVKEALKLNIISYIKSCFKREGKPVGGVKVIYQHCAILHSLGYEVYPLLMGEFIGNFFDIHVTYKKFEDVVDKIGENDIVVSTEFRPYEGLIFSPAYKIIFVQNFYGVLSNLYQNDKGKNYYELGYDRVITCSDYLNNYIYNTMNLPSEIITNGIDLDRFLPDQKLRKKRSVLALSRKNKADLDKIKYLIKDLDCEIKVVDNLTESELISEYQSADIFLATGYPEGFGLPPLEAMACGCVVIGFTGGGASEYMIHGETALVAEDGDCIKVAEYLETLINDMYLTANLRKNGLAMAKRYSLDKTKMQLKKFFDEIIENN